MIDKRNKRNKRNKINKTKYDSLDLDLDIDLDLDNDQITTRLHGMRWDEMDEMR